MCQDCVTFLTDAQAQAKANSTFLDALIENIENQCDLLGPSMSSLVKSFLLNLLFIYFSLKKKVEMVFRMALSFLPSLSQCREYVSQYSSLIVEQLMNMVS